jgi:hypothetical protein
MLQNQEEHQQGQPHEVNLVVTIAPLLSGGLRDCAYEDTAATKCRSGGVAAVQAYVRYYTSSRGIDESNYPAPGTDRINDTSTFTNETTTTTDSSSNPVLVVPLGDFKSPLTEMSRFFFGVNVMIYANELHWRTWTVPAYTLLHRRFDERTVYDAQEPLFPAVVSNVVTSPIEVWHPYVKSVHFDEETNLALLYITKAYLNNTLSQVESVQRLVHFVYKYNQANRCETEFSPEIGSAHSLFQDLPFSEWWRSQGDQILETIRASSDVEASQTQYQWNDTQFLPSQPYDADNCFVPVVVFDDQDKEQFDDFVDAFNQTNVTLAPRLILDVRGHLLGDIVEDPVIQTLVTAEDYDGDGEASPPRTWLVSYIADPEAYDQVQITLSPNNQHIMNISLIRDSLLELPEEALSEEYYQDLDNIRQYAHEALESSLAREVGIRSLAMPEQTDSVDGFRYCYTGECEMGNLCADALRWMADADIAVVPSFMFDGPGWAEGEIRTLEILENIPYATSRCEGTMTGNSLLRLLNHTMHTATFGGFDDIKDGGRFLQISGLNVVYNPLLEGNRILSVDVWDKDRNQHVPLQRTHLYSFASCAHLCFTFEDYPPFLGEFLVEAGEVPAVQITEMDIKEEMLVFLRSKSFDGYFQPMIEGRLVNDTTRADALHVGLRESCVARSSYWSAETLDCEPCPNFDRVTLSKRRIELQGRAYSDDHLIERVVISNEESFAIELTADTLGLPANVALSISSNGSTSPTNVTGTSYILQPNEGATMEIDFDASERSAGRDTSSVVFALSDLGRSGDCSIVKIKLDFVAYLSQSSDDNHLGNVAAFGYTSAALITVASVAFAAWVRVRRNTRVVSTMQPVFLMTLCIGVLLMGSSLIPISLDDGVIDERGCDIACMTRPWLLSVGFILCCAALYSKLLRINKLFNSAQFRRLKVRERDVILPSCILVLTVFVLNLTWTLIEPLRWERVPVQGQAWNTYGKCSLGDGRVGEAMLGSIVAVCAIGFTMTGVQAFQARNISSEYSESTYIGIAVFSWAQLCLVAVPVLFLMDDDNVVARYCLVVGFIFAVCMSMMLVVFVPVIIIKPRTIDSQRVVLSFQGVLNGQGSGRSDTNESKELNHWTAAKNGAGGERSGSVVATGEDSTPRPESDKSDEVNHIPGETETNSESHGVDQFPSKQGKNSREGDSVAVGRADYFSIQPSHSVVEWGDSNDNPDSGEDDMVEHTA